MAAQTQSGKKPNRTKLYGTLGLLAVIVFGVRWVTTVETGTTWTQAPPEVQGAWTTTEARYAGRELHITGTHVMLTLGEAGAISGLVSIARELEDNGKRVIRIEYDTEQGPDAIELALVPGGLVHFRNQPDIRWSRGGAAPPVMIDRTQEPDGNSGGGIPPIVWLAVLLGLGGLVVARRGSSDGLAPAKKAEVEVVRSDPIPISSRGGAPSLIRGVWTSPDPRQEGRSIRIAGEYGFAQFGPGDIRRGGNIESIRQWKEDGSRVVELVYDAEEGSTELQMIIDKNGHMRLRDSKSLWVRRVG